MELSYTERNGIMYPDLALPKQTPPTPLASTAECASTISKSTAAAPTQRSAPRARSISPSTKPNRRPESPKNSKPQTFSCRCKR